MAAKSTTIVLPEAGMKLGLLAAVLNSRLMTQIYEVMFPPDEPITAVSGNPSRV